MINNPQNYHGGGGQNKIILNIILYHTIFNSNLLLLLHHLHYSLNFFIVSCIISIWILISNCMLHVIIISTTRILIQQHCKKLSTIHFLPLLGFTLLLSCPEASQPKHIFFLVETKNINRSDSIQWHNLPSNQISFLQTLCSFNG